MEKNNINRYLYYDNVDKFLTSNEKKYNRSKIPIYHLHIIDNKKKISENNNFMDEKSCISENIISEFMNLANINDKLILEEIFNKNDTKNNNLNKFETIKNYPFKKLDIEIKTINDLILLGKEYETKYLNKKYNYSLNLKILSNLVEPLTELNNMIGLNNIKNKIFEQIIFYLQNLDDKNYDMLHTVIQGEPGIGKTELAKILGKIYANLGFLSKSKFISVKRSDLIGGFLGQTAMKTNKIIEEASGGVLFIDEAYSLGNIENKDIYSKECIDTLTAALTEKKNDLVVIIAGYKEDLENCFFSQNRGLERRFNWKFELDKYTANELKEIFFKKIYDMQWSILNKNDISVDYFENNLNYFNYNGGDMETLFQKCKMAHSIRSLLLSENEKKKISIDDFKTGLKSFLDLKKNNNTNNNVNMYV